MNDATPTPYIGYHVMAKPAGPSCNLRCAYCFYLEKSKLYPDRADRVMPDAVLEAYIRQYIEGQPHLPEYNFAWQGGEPTLAGLDFFRKAVSLQEKYAGGRPVHNAFQTNGILLDEEWARFLHEHGFLIGLSLDGPERFHDAFRRDAADRPTFRQVMRALELMKTHQVEFNILACVNRKTAEAPDDVYAFLRANGSGFIQFIPIVERCARAADANALTLVTPDQEWDAAVTPWSVRPLQYGRFLERVFDIWVRRDVGSVFVQLFDTSLEAWVGYEPSLCFFRIACGDAMVLEHNGDLYACDHFVYPEYKLGNILETPIAELAASEKQRAFGNAKQTSLPAYCRACPCHFVCHGECPKHRFLTTPEGDYGLNYLCAGYRHFFEHVDPYMRFMANELRQQRPPANVMAWVRQQEGAPIKSHRERHPDAASSEKTEKQPLPDAPCPCGSGRRYKKCCGQQPH